MLILSRFHGQRVTITTPLGETIEIAVLNSGRRGINLGFTAPKEFNIVRNELLREEPRQTLDNS